MFQIWFTIILGSVTRWNHTLPHIRRPLGRPVTPARELHCTIHAVFTQVPLPKVAGGRTHATIVPYHSSAHHTGITTQQNRHNARRNLALTWEKGTTILQERIQSEFNFSHCNTHVIYNALHVYFNLKEQHIISISNIHVRNYGVSFRV